MLGFAARRLVSMLLVLFSISVMTFLIFFATPGSTPLPASRDETPTSRRCARSARTSGSTSRCRSGTR